MLQIFVSISLKFKYNISFSSLSLPAALNHTMLQYDSFGVDYQTTLYHLHNYLRGKMQLHHVLAVNFH